MTELVPDHPLELIPTETIERALRNGDRRVRRGVAAAKALIPGSCSSTYTSGIGTPEAIDISSTMLRSRFRFRSAVSLDTRTPPNERATTPPPPRSSMVL